LAYRPIAKRRLCKRWPLLCIARNIHTRSNRRTVFSVVRSAAVSGQQLGKHVPATKDTNSTTEVRRFLCGPCRAVISIGGCWVPHGTLWTQNLSEWSWRISTIRSRCQGTACEDTAGRKKAQRVLWWFVNSEEQRWCCDCFWLMHSPIQHPSVVTHTHTHTHTRHNILQNEEEKWGDIQSSESWNKYLMAITVSCTHKNICECFRTTQPGIFVQRMNVRRLIDSGSKTKLPQ
jgi:hypothetical protein